jgi:ABC-2 type transport system ATP-binding protein
MATALVHSPALLVLDEPTTGVDVEAPFDLWQLIARLRDEGVTVLLTTHHLQEAESLCDRIGILKEGRLAAEGSLESLRTTVPAEVLLSVQTNAEATAEARASELGWTKRTYGGKLTFLLPNRFTIPELVNLLADVPLTSISLEEIGLEHVYLETMHGDGVAGHDAAGVNLGSEA